MSRAVRPLSDEDLQELLAQCRRDNARHDVTGVLFYSHGNIAQLIEGEAEVIHPLYEKIAQDGRHSNVTKLADRPIAARSFEGWSMAFHPLESAAFTELQGFFSPNEAPANPDSLTIADSLLLDLLRQAVFGPASSHSPAETDN